MKQTEPCAIYQDLMPLYLEGLLREASSRDLADHLKTCPACQAKYQTLAAPLHVGPPAETDSFDYLQKIKQRQRRRSILIGLAALFAVALSWLFYPTATQSFGITKIDRQGESFVIEGELHDSGKAFAFHRIKHSDDGYDVTIYSMPVNPLHRSGRFRLSLPADKPLRLAKALTIEPDGFVVSGRARRLFHKQTPYIGNNSLVGGLLHELIGIDYGGVTFEIDSAAEPFGLHIYLNQPVSPDRPVRESFQGQSALLLALIDNAEYISWHYHQVKDQVVTFDLATVDEWAGRPVKQFAGSERSIQELINRLGIK